MAKFTVTCDDFNKTYCPKYVEVLNIKAKKTKFPKQNYQKGLRKKTKALLLEKIKHSKRTLVKFRIVDRKWQVERSRTGKGAWRIHEKYLNIAVGLKTENEGCRLAMFAWVKKYIPATRSFERDAQLQGPHSITPIACKNIK